MDLERHDDVFVLTMRRGENRFNPDNLDAISAALDEVEGAEGRPALVITGEGKFFSNGLDLEWMGSAPDGGPQEVIERTMKLFARVLTFPTGVVAAINGHCFAAGAMLALACDTRVMREDRGFFCLPEVDINMVFLPGMSSLVAARLSPQSAHESMLTGRRYDAPAALSAGIVEGIAAEVDVLGAGMERARELAGKDPATVAGIKRGLYSDVVEKLHLPLTASLTG